jgi:hypothetical protein
MPASNLPPVLLNPGWYSWHFIRSESEKQWETFHAANMATLKLRKSFSGDTSRAMVVVFEIVRPLQWPLPGIPSPAPKKGRTTLKDLSTAPEYNTPDLVELFAELAGSAKQVAGSLGGAGTLLLWGGAAVLLFQLFRWSQPPARPVYVYADRDD